MQISSSHARTLYNELTISTKGTSQDSSSGKNIQKQKQAQDSVHFSAEALSRLARMRTESAEDTNAAANSTSSDGSGPKLSVTDMKKSLADLEDKLSEENGEAAHRLSATTIADLKQQISAVDSENASDEQIKTLFSKVQQALKSDFEQRFPQAAEAASRLAANGVETAASSMRSTEGTGVQGGAPAGGRGPGGPGGPGGHGGPGGPVGPGGPQGAAPAKQTEEADTVTNGEEDEEDEELSLIQQILDSIEAAYEEQTDDSASSSKEEYAKDILVRLTDLQQRTGIFSEEDYSGIVAELSSWSSDSE